MTYMDEWIFVHEESQKTRQFGKMRKLIDQWEIDARAGKFGSFDRSFLVSLVLHRQDAEDYDKAIVAAKELIALQLPEETPRVYDHLLLAELQETVGLFEAAWETHRVAREWDGIRESENAALTRTALEIALHLGSNVSLDELRPLAVEAFEFSVEIHAGLYSPLHRDLPWVHEMLSRIAERLGDEDSRKKYLKLHYEAPDRKADAMKQSLEEFDQHLLPIAERKVADVEFVRALRDWYQRYFCWWDWPAKVEQFESESERFLFETSDEEIPISDLSVQACRSSLDHWKKLRAEGKTKRTWGSWVKLYLLEDLIIHKRRDDCCHICQGDLNFCASDGTIILECDSSSHYFPGDATSFETEDKLPDSWAGSFAMKSELVAAGFLREDGVSIGPGTEMR